MRFTSVEMLRSRGVGINFLRCWRCGGYEWHIEITLGKWVCSWVLWERG
jgi:hypothetical protein